MKFIIYKDHQHQWRWSLRSGNGKIIADSAEGYHRKDKCMKGLRAVQRCATAKIITVL